MLSGITDINAKEVVLSFIAALNDENFDVARSYAADDMILQECLAPVTMQENILVICGT